MTYIELINIIKKSYNDKWLTSSQRKIYEKVTTKYKIQKLINIYGNQGVGKTFLCWNLVDYYAGNYATSLDELEKNKVNVLDNYSFQKQAIRSLFPVINAKSINRIFVITEKKALEDITALELVFSPEDRKVFKNNLWKYCEFEFTKEKYDMHSLIKANI